MLRPTNKKILLASNSPRRRELLHMIVPDFGIAEMHDIDESFPSSLSPEEVPAYLSRLKSQAYKDQLVEDEIIITADTVVILDGKILGKPHSREDAIEMLVSLMGRTHTVVTGVTLTTLSDSVTFSDSTKVTFGEISRDKIEEYVDQYCPFDKAGAYGIQEWIGAVAIESIQGCFYNVMGLPVHSLYHHLSSI